MIFFKKKEPDKKLIFELTKEIPKYVKKEKDLVTICKVWTHFLPQSEGKGQMICILPYNFTTLVWDNVSVEFNNAISDLEKRKDLFMVPISIDYLF